MLNRLRRLPPQGAPGPAPQGRTDRSTGADQDRRAKIKAVDGLMWFRGSTAREAVTPCSGRFPFQPRRVAPQIFQAVEGAFVAMKNVHDHLQIIEHHPLAGGKSVNRHGPQRMILSQSRFNFACDRFSCGSDVPEQITKKSVKRRDPAQIQDDNVFRLFVRGEFSAGFC